MTKSRSGRKPENFWTATERGGTRPLRSADARRIGALRELPEVRAAERVAAREGVRTWVVGGAVRDALLGRRVEDADVTVSGRLDVIARALEEAGFGRAVPLSEKNPRAIRIAGRRTLDLVEAEGGSITRDLARRDFTVNALALDLSSGELLDPHRGVEDLRERRLRLIAERNIADDPLRAFRGARFIATHGLRPDREAAAACRRYAGLLAGSAPERVTAELVRILEAPRAAPALRWAAAHGLLGPALRLELDAAALHRASREVAPLDSPALLRAAPERRGLLRLALLSSALGLSPRAAAAWLRRLRSSRNTSGEILRLRTLADQARDARDEDAAWRWVRDAGAGWRDALLLLASGRSHPTARVKSLASRARRARRRPRVRGADVLAWTGLPGGPRVGELLAELEVEILRGRVRSRKDARSWLVARAGARGPNGQPTAVR